MTEKAAVHSTFVLERVLDASPERVFDSFAIEKEKRRWFIDETKSAMDEYTTDFRVGGGEKSRFRFHGGPPGAPPAGTKMGNDTTYLDIVPNERIVFAYTMTVGDRPMSASLATVEFVKVGDKTRLTFTEQGAFFEPSDGPEMRKGGWTHILGRLAEAVKTAE